MPFLQANDNSVCGWIDPILTVWFIFITQNPGNAGDERLTFRDYAQFEHFEMDITIIRSLLFLKLRRRGISGQKTTSRSLPGWALAQPFARNPQYDEYDGSGSLRETDCGGRQPPFPKR
jgi:hypothetical protein